MDFKATKRKKLDVPTSDINLEEQLKYIDDKVIEYDENIILMKQSFNDIMSDVNKDVIKSKLDSSNLQNNIEEMSKELKSFAQVIGSIETRSDKIENIYVQVNTMFSTIQDIKQNIEGVVEDFKLDVVTQLEDVATTTKTLKKDFEDQAQVQIQTQKSLMQKVKKSNIFIFSTLVASGVIAFIIGNNIINDVYTIKNDASQDLKQMKVEATKVKTIVGKSRSIINNLKKDVSNLDYAKHNEVKEGFNVASEQIQDLKGEIENLKIELGEEKKRDKTTKVVYQNSSMPGSYYIDTKIEPKKEKNYIGINIVEAPKKHFTTCYKNDVLDCIQFTINDNNKYFSHYGDRYKITSYGLEEI